MKSRTFQSRFVKSITQNEELKDIMAQIIPVGELEVVDVFEVYRDDYYTRLREVLASVYKVTATLISNFDFIAESFVRENPSIDPNINNYHPAFPHYLEGRVDPELTELARLEWEISALIDRPFQAPLEYDANDLLSKRIRLADHITLIKTNRPIWHLYHDGPEGESSESILLYKREDEQIFMRRLSEGQAAVLDEIIANGTIMGEFSIDPTEMQELFLFLRQENIIYSLE